MEQLHAKKQAEGLVIKLPKKTLKQLHMQRGQHGVAPSIKYMMFYGYRGWHVDFPTKEVHRVYLIEIDVRPSRCSALDDYSEIEQKEHRVLKERRV